MNIATMKSPASLRYLIRHGNIASCIHVSTDSAEYTAVYLNDAPKVEAYRGSNMSRDVWHDLPIEVAALIVRQFKAVFALPVEARAAFIKTLEPITIDTVYDAADLKKGGPYDDASSEMKR